MSQKKQVHLNLFIYGTGHHQAAWRAEESAAEKLCEAQYYINLAQIAEQGLLDAVFFADGQAVSPEAAQAGPTWFFEPVTLLSAICQCTRNIGLVCTISASFYSPFHAARMLGSLQHLSQGRAGINVVTSMWDTEAQNHSLTELPAHAQRYARATEFIDVLRQLWESYPHQAVQIDRAGDFTIANQLQEINHEGQHFSVRGPLNMPNSEHGEPVLFQAGSSPAGRELAATHAEAIYSVAADQQMAAEFAQDISERTSALGNQSQRPLIMPGLVTYVGRTLEEAKAKQRELNDLLPTEDALRQLGVFLQQDTSLWPLDEPVPGLPPLAEFTGPAGRYTTILRLIELHQPTVRELLGLLAAGGGHCTMVGTPEMIVDEMEDWLDSGAADGFNLMPPSLPGSLEDFIDLVIPELQRRGRFRTRYESTTLRGNLGLTVPQETVLAPS
ncbi:LLM class flavin-dependent oxidoreductase [Arthrobacter sp. NIO-1057]|uniref:LLM class flavin-dependent oxidoreductase n=1 Tax=Arthrobacter sp. NIO-1057 TaxID=993071 RepID=UPI00071E27E9|nr:LLM class flavin-dependent oxidoreductase [Arthrobacter sp. NIO-1057]KSU65585.1 monooxygenase [Arthrobacter sp. NIO-1057]SCC38760.1 FMN-dependent oxidoreductase, nitrilotriacetate monooxygenase family [Arthrobacter sp. NIO-1057]